jgi:hypothetical protein
MFAGVFMGTVSTYAIPTKLQEHQQRLAKIADLEEKVRELKSKDQEKTG